MIPSGLIGNKTFKTLNIFSFLQVLVTAKMKLRCDSNAAIAQRQLLKAKQLQKYLFSSDKSLQGYLHAAIRVMMVSFGTT